jgi:HSP20 family molecular chaperone IbpA
MFLDLTDFSKLINEMFQPEISAETNNEIEVLLPGVLKESIDITFKSNLYGTNRYNILEVRAKTKKGKNVFVEKILGNNIDENATARYEDGILTIKLRETEKKEPKKIKVE